MIIYAYVRYSRSVWMSQCPLGSENLCIFALFSLCLNVPASSRNGEFMHICVILVLIGIPWDALGEQIPCAYAPGVW